MAMSQSGKTGLTPSEPALSLWPIFPVCRPAFLVALCSGDGRWGLRCKSHRSRRDPSSLPRAGPAQHHYTGFQQQVSLYWWFCKRCLAAPKICLSNSQRSVGEGKAVLSSLEEETLLQGIASQFLISHGAMGTFLSVS